VSTAGCSFSSGLGARGSGLFLAALAACSPNPGGSDGGSDAGDPEIILKASGTASVHPLGAAFLADAGLANPGVAGLQLRIEEPFKVAVGDPLGVFGSMTLDATGTFSVPNISSELVNLGVAAGIRDDSADGGSSARIVRSATVLYDVALEGQKPVADITSGKAFAIPTAFHNRLNAAITPAAISAITMAGGNQNNLQAAGWVLGRVVDASGAPVSSVTVSASPASYNAQFFYPNADFTGTGASTSANGTFVFVHTGGAVATFRINVAGRSEYKQRNLGAAKDAALVLTYYPGTTPPP
jgi:hypothetical protein